MTLDQLRARQAQINSRLAAIAAAITTDGRTLSNAEVHEDQQLNAELAALDQTESFLTEQSARASLPIRQNGTARPRTISSAAPAVLTATTQAQRNGDKFQGESWARLRLAQLTAALAVKDGEEPIHIPQLLAKLYPQRPELARVVQARITRRQAAGVEGGATVSGEAGAELLRTDATFTGDFIEYLYSQTLFDQLGLRDISGDVTIKGQDGAFTGYFVGEKKPIPASIGSYLDLTLRPLKAAGLTYLSKDLIKRSAPEALQLFRDGVVEAISQVVDTKFFSADAVSAGVSPAGILQGLSGVASVGGRLQDLYADLLYLTGIFVTAKQKGELTLVSNRIIANQIAHLLNPETFRPAFEGKVTMNGGTVNGLPYKTGENIPASNLLLIKGGDIYKIADSGVEVSLSTDATIEADTVPSGDGSGPTAQSASMVSMFQTEMVAIKAVRDISWGMRRSAAIIVARKTGVKYDGTQSTTD